MIITMTVLSLTPMVIITMMIIIIMMMIMITMITIKMMIIMIMTMTFYLIDGDQSVTDGDSPFVCSTPWFHSAHL